MNHSNTSDPYEVLKAELKIDLLKVHDKLVSELKDKYNASGFKDRIDNSLPVDAVVKLVNNKIQGQRDGFFTLYTYGRLDLSLEHFLLDNKKYHILFNGEILNKAKLKLRKMNYDVSRWT